MRILIVGPSIARSKGGMATVISDQLADPNINKYNQLDYLISHVEGSIFEKVLHSLKSLFYILFNHRKYDIVHFHTATYASFYRKSLLLRASKWLNKKTILHMHGFDFDSFYLNSKPVLKKYIRSSLYKSDKILVLSDYWKNFFNKEFLNLEVVVLENGIDIKSYLPYISEPTVIDKYLFLGRLGERKGVYDLLKAIDIIVNTHKKSELQFYLAGDGDLDKVKKIITNSNLADNVKLLGWLNNDEKKKILKEVQVVILPSYEEGLPMALIESMACGKVVISTYVGGIPDLVKHGFNGYLFDAGNVKELVKYILLVNKNPELMISISKNNISTISEKFNLEHLSAKLNSIYNSL